MKPRAYGRDWSETPIGPVEAWSPTLNVLIDFLLANRSRSCRGGGGRWMERLKVLFITGFAENAMIGRGHLGPGMEVLSKPFEITCLAARVRELIDR